MTLFEAVKNQQELLLKDNKDIVVFKQFSGDFTKNAKRLLRLYDEYIKKYGEKRRLRRVPDFLPVRMQDFLHSGEPEL